MDEKLEKYADTVKNHEYQELFPETPVEKAKEDEEKVKEALFQVHHMLYNKQLHRKIHDPGHNSHYIKQKEAVKPLNEKEEKRLKKQLKGATLKTENGETMIPKTDIKDVLSTNEALLD